MINENLKVRRARTSATLLIVVILSNCAVSGKQQAPPDESKNANAGTLLAQLREAVNSNRIEAAKPLCDEIIRSWPGSGHAMDALAEIGFLYARKESRFLDDTMTQLYAEYSGQAKFPRAIYRVADGYISRGGSRSTRARTLGKARALYDQAVAKVPDHPDAVWLHVVSIRHQMAEGKFAQADQAIEKLKKDYSRYPELCTIIYNLGMEYRRRFRQPEKAKALFEYVLQNSSDSSLAFKGRTEVLCCEIRLGNYSAAADAIEALKKEYSRHPELCTNIVSLAKMYWNRNQHDKARDLFQYAADNSSDSDTAIVSRRWVIMCEDRLGNDSAVDRAINSFVEDCCKHKSPHSEILKVVEVLCDMGRFDEARDFCKSISEKNSDIDFAVMSRGGLIRCEVRSGNYSVAVQAIAALKKDHPKHPELYASMSFLADAFWKSNKLGEARALYRYVCENCADSNFALKTQMQLMNREIELRKGGSLEQTIEALKQREDSDRTRLCASMCALADDCYYHRKNYDKAGPLYEYVAENVSDSDLAIKAKALLGRCQIRSGNDSDAERTINALKIDYSRHKDLCEKLYDLSYEYWYDSDYVRSKALCEYIIRKFPDSDFAVKSQRGVARCEIRLEDYAAAEEAIKTLKSDYSGHKDLCSELHALSFEYRWKEKEAEGKDLWQYVCENSPDSDLVFKALMEVLGCEIRLGDYSAAEKTFARLKKDYSKHPGLFRGLYSLATATGKVKEKVHKAREFYQYIARNSPDRALAIESQAHVVGCELLLGNESGIVQGLDRLLRDFCDHENLISQLDFLNRRGARSQINSRVINLLENEPKVSLKKQTVMLSIQRPDIFDTEKCVELYLASSATSGLIVEDIKEVVSFCEEKGKDLCAAKICQYYMKHGEAGKSKEEIELRLYSNLLSSRQDSEKILVNLDEFISRNKDAHKVLAARATLLKGRILVYSGEVDKAIASLEQMNIELLEPSEIQSGLYLMGYGYLVLNQFDKSQEILTRLIDTYPSSTYTSQARQLVSRIEDMK